MAAVALEVNRLELSGNLRKLTCRIQVEASYQKLVDDRKSLKKKSLEHLDSLLGFVPSHILPEPTSFLAVTQEPEGDSQRLMLVYPEECGWWKQDASPLADRDEKDLKQNHLNLSQRLERLGLGDENWKRILELMSHGPIIDLPIIQELFPVDTNHDSQAAHTPVEISDFVFDVILDERTTFVRDQFFLTRSGNEGCVVVFKADGALAGSEAEAGDEVTAVNGTSVSSVMNEAATWLCEYNKWTSQPSNPVITPNLDALKAVHGPLSILANSSPPPLTSLRVDEMWVFLPSVAPAWFDLIWCDQGTVEPTEYFFRNTERSLN